MNLSEYFKPYRRNTIGCDQTMPLVSGEIKPILYADWVASGRLYNPIEAFMKDKIGPMVANTHTETTLTGTTMTQAYHDARNIIKKTRKCRSFGFSFSCGIRNDSRR